MGLNNFQELGLRSLQILFETKDPIKAGEITYYFISMDRMVKSVLTVYVNNIILTGNDGDEAHKLKEDLSNEFEIKDLGNLRYFLRIEVAKSK